MNKLKHFISLQRAKRRRARHIHLSHNALIGIFRRLGTKAAEMTAVEKKLFYLSCRLKLMST